MIEVGKNRGAEWKKILEVKGFFNPFKRKWNQMGIKSQNIIKLAT
jgi:hypothetical protein